MSRSSGTRMGVKRKRRAGRGTGSERRVSISSGTGMRVKRKRRLGEMGDGEIGEIAMGDGERGAGDMGDGKISSDSEAFLVQKYSMAH